MIIAVNEIHQTSTAKNRSFQAKDLLKPLENLVFLQVKQIGGSTYNVFSGFICQKRIATINTPGNIPNMPYSMTILENNITLSFSSMENALTGLCAFLLDNPTFKA